VARTDHSSASSAATAHAKSSNRGWQSDCSLVRGPSPLKTLRLAATLAFLVVAITGVTTPALADPFGVDRVPPSDSCSACDTPASIAGPLQPSIRQVYLELSRAMGSGADSPSISDDLLDGEVSPVGPSLFVDFVAAQSPVAAFVEDAPTTAPMVNQSAILLIVCVGVFSLGALWRRRVVPTARPDRRVVARARKEDSARYQEFVFRSTPFGASLFAPLRI